MNQKGFIISDGLRPYVEKEFGRRGIPYTIAGDKIYPSEKISGNKFHMIVKTAKAAKLTHETGLLHVARHQLAKKGELPRLFQKYRTHGFVVC